MNLNQVTIPSLDLEKSVPFYEKLGLKLIVDAPPNYVRFECPSGSSTFSVHKTTQLPTGERVFIYLNSFMCLNISKVTASAASGALISSSISTTVAK